MESDIKNMSWRNSSESEMIMIQPASSLSTITLQTLGNLVSADSGTIKGSVFDELADELGLRQLKQIIVTRAQQKGECPGSVLLMHWAETDQQHTLFVLKSVIEKLHRPDILKVFMKAAEDLPKMDMHVSVATDEAAEAPHAFIVSTLISSTVGDSLSQSPHLDMVHYKYSIVEPSDVTWDTQASHMKGRQLNLKRCRRTQTSTADSDIMDCEVSSTQPDTSFIHEENTSATLNVKEKRHLSPRPPPRPYKMKPIDVNNRNIVSPQFCPTKNCTLSSELSEHSYTNPSHPYENEPNLCSYVKFFDSCESSSSDSMELDFVKPDPLSETRNINVVAPFSQSVEFDVVALPYMEGPSTSSEKIDNRSYESNKQFHSMQFTSNTGGGSMDSDGDSSSWLREDGGKVHTDSFDVTQWSVDLDTSVNMDNMGSLVTSTYVDVELSTGTAPKVPKRTSEPPPPRPPRKSIHTVLETEKQAEYRSRVEMAIQRLEQQHVPGWFGQRKKHEMDAMMSSVANVDGMYFLWAWTDPQNKLHIVISVTHLGRIYQFKIHTRKSAEGITFSIEQSNTAWFTDMNDLINYHKENSLIAGSDTRHIKLVQPAQ